jgi:uncharacterized protein YukE
MITDARRGTAVTQADPAELLATAADLTGAADSIEALAGRAQGTVAGLGGTDWSGAAHDGFLDVWVRRRANLDGLAGVWRDAAGVLRGLAWSLETARSAWRQLELRAGQLGLRLLPDASLVDAATGAPASQSPSRGFGTAGLLDPTGLLDPAGVLALRAEVDRVLDEATAADAEAARSLHELAERAPVAPPSFGAATTALLSAGEPGAGGRVAPDAVGALPPALVAAWWAALGSARRRELTAADPALVGGLNGIPIADRDRANRRTLAAARILTAGQRAQAGRQLAAGGLDAGQRSALLREQKRLAARTRSLDKIATEGDFLLLFDPSGQGRAAVAFGDPAHAPNVAVVVPGTNNSLDNFTNPMANAINLRDETQRLFAGQPERQTAVVAWLYDAPDGVEAGDDRLSREEAPLLRSFVDGLRVTHQGQPHVTVSGHSYGSTTVGFAARDGQLAADDITVIGSPGLGQGVTTAGELHADPRTRVWAGRAPDDPIQSVFALDPGARALLGPLERAGIVEFSDEPILRHGSDPSLPGFGALRFATGSYVDPADPRDSHGHSSYYTPRTASVSNLARIAAGAGDQVSAP